MYATERFQLYASGVLIPSFEQGIWQSENSLLTELQLKKCLQAQALSLPIQQEKQMLQVSNFPFETGLERPYYFIFLKGQKAYVKNIEFKPNSKKNMLISRKWLMQVGWPTCKMSIWSMASTKYSCLMPQTSFFGI